MPKKSEKKIILLFLKKYSKFIELLSYIYMEKWINRNTDNRLKIDLSSSILYQILMKFFLNKDEISFFSWSFFWNKHEISFLNPLSFFG